MQNISSVDIKETFNFYRNTILEISSDINFWPNFFDTSILNFNNSLKEDYAIYQAGFHVNDLQPNSKNGQIRFYKDIHKIETNELVLYRKKFFSWVINLSILKAYNSTELLLLRSIQLAYFPSEENPSLNKKNADKINALINLQLPKADRTNNRHIIQFIKSNSKNFDTFSNQKVRDFKSTWSDFFEFFSILRNIISHHSSIISKDSFNNIKSHSKDIFERHFVIVPDTDGLNILQSKADIDFYNFLYLINDFALNTAKFILEQKDLSFLDMEKPSL